MENLTEFLTEMNRMCDHYLECECIGCPFYDKACTTLFGIFADNSPEKIVKIVETWSKENPK